MEYFDAIFTEIRMKLESDVVEIRSWHSEMSSHLGINPMLHYLIILNRRPPTLSVLTPYKIELELTHFGLEATLQFQAYNNVNFMKNSLDSAYKDRSPYMIK